MALPNAYPNSKVSLRADQAATNTSNLHIPSKEERETWHAADVQVETKT